MENQKQNEGTVEATETSTTNETATSTEGSENTSEESEGTDTASESSETPVDEVLEIFNFNKSTRTDALYVDPQLLFVYDLINGRKEYENSVFTIDDLADSIEERGVQTDLKGYPIAKLDGKIILKNGESISIQTAIDRYDEQEKDDAEQEDREVNNRYRFIKSFFALPENERKALGGSIYVVTDGFRRSTAIERLLNEDRQVNKGLNDGKVPFNSIKRAYQKKHVEQLADMILLNSGKPLVFKEKYEIVEAMFTQCKQKPNDIAKKTGLSYAKVTELLHFMKAGETIMDMIMDGGIGVTVAAQIVKDNPEDEVGQKKAIKDAAKAAKEAGKNKITKKAVDASSGTAKYDTLTTLEQVLFQLKQNGGTSPETLRAIELFLDFSLTKNDSETIVEVIEGGESVSEISAKRQAVIDAENKRIEDAKTAKEAEKTAATARKETIKTAKVVVSDAKKANKAADKVAADAKKAVDKAVKAETDAKKVVDKAQKAADNAKGKTAVDAAEKKVTAEKKAKDKTTKAIEKAKEILTEEETKAKVTNDALTTANDALTEAEETPASQE